MSVLCVHAAGLTAQPGTHPYIDVEHFEPCGTSFTLHPTKSEASWSQDLIPFHPALDNTEAS